MMFEASTSLHLWFRCKGTTFLCRGTNISSKNFKKSIFTWYMSMYVCAHTLLFYVYFCLGKLSPCPWFHPVVQPAKTNLKMRSWNPSNVSLCFFLCIVMFPFYTPFLIVKCYEMPVFKAFFGYFPYFSEDNVHFFRKKFVCEGAIL